MVSELPFIFFKVLFFQLKEEYKVRKRFHPNQLFKKTDKLLKKAYLFSNPYQIAKNFSKKIGEQDIHTYGETPLTILYEILKLVKIDENDVFLDLGAGRGRNVLFVSTFLKLQAAGIEHNPIFHEKAQKIAQKLPKPPVFLLENMLKTSLIEQATIIYFYGICLEDHDFLSMIKQLELTKKYTTIITVSFPLSDYSDSFSLLCSEKFPYPWGEATVYIQHKN